MRLNITRRIALIVLLLLAITIPAAAIDDDPLVSESYLKESYTLDFLAEVRRVINASMQPIYAKRIKKMRAYGGTIFVRTGGSFVLTEGQASANVCLGAVVDATLGGELTHRAELKSGRLYIAAEDTLVAIMVPDDASIVVDGDYAKPDYDSATFSDVGTAHWAFEYVEAMSALSLVNGRGGDVFDPDANMTRGEFVTVLGRLCRADIAGDADSVGFADVDATMYYAPYINWAVSEGLINGFDDGLVHPNDRITRAQMAVLIVRFAESVGIDLSADDTENDAVLTDESEIPDWASEGVAEALSAGLVRGRDDGRFDPNGDSRRSEVCTVLYRLITRGLEASSSSSES